MNIDRINPELRKLAKRLPPVPIHHYWLLRIMRLALKLMANYRSSAEGVETKNVQLSHREIRIYQPRDKLSGVGVLWIHGGGFVSGCISMDDPTCSRYAKELNAVVVSVEYRLAPENPYPAGSDDIFEAWKWMLENAEQLGIDPERILIAGQSGGGGQAAFLAQRIFDSGGVQPLAQLLFCPMLDDRTIDRTELDAEKHLLWNNKNNRAAWNWYLDGKFDCDAYLEKAVPARRRDLKGLPHAWIGIGDADLFYEESKIYAERLRESGVAVALDVVPGGFHGFEVAAPDAEITRSYLSRHFSFIRSLL